MKQRFAYFDTCLFVSLFKEDKGTVAAGWSVAEFTRNGKQPFAISDLIRLEFNSVITRDARAGCFDKKQAQTIMDNFTFLCRENVLELPVVAGDFQKAQQMIAEQAASLKALDALHLAVCHNNDCIMVTADKQLAAAAATFDVECHFVSYE